MNRYWDNKGKYQKECNILWNTLVPPHGPAGTWMGNLLIAMSKIYYDRYNNGFANGPFNEEVNLLMEHEDGIKKHMENPQLFDEFIAAFRRINHGEETVSSKWDGDEAMEAVVDGVVMYIWGAYKKQTFKFKRILRPFTKDMENAYIKACAKPGNTLNPWDDFDRSWLTRRLAEEVSELTYAVLENKNIENIRKECADVANLALFIYASTLSTK